MSLIVKFQKIRISKVASPKEPGSGESLSFVEAGAQRDVLSHTEEAVVLHTHAVLPYLQCHRCDHAPLQSQIRKSHMKRTRTLNVSAQFILPAHQISTCKIKNADFLKIFIHLKKLERFSVYWFIIQMAATARALPV